MTRRQLFSFLTALGLVRAAPEALAASQPTRADKLVLTETQWRQRLSPQAYRVLREEGTEPPHTSPLNAEKRPGLYQCAGCSLALFSSEAKYESGTGWPSFWQPLPNGIASKVDFKLIVPRTEYHCRRCGGHQGHVFEDGPKPSGKRYCNNGVALNFKPSKA